MIIVRRGPGVVGTMARTAVVAGTATAVSRGVSNSMDRSAAAKQQEAVNAAQQAQAQQPAQPSQSDITSQIEKLADMKAKGTLSAAEYEAAKKKLLGSS